MSNTRQLRAQAKRERRRIRNSQPQAATNPLGSTGPRTAEGKAISRENARQHSLAGAVFTVLATESEEEFRHLLSSYENEHKPAGQTEWAFVLRLAQSFWMMQRALRLGNEALDNNDDKRAALMLRYQTTHERTFNTSLKQLKLLQSERKALACNEPELALAERIARQNHRTLRNHVQQLKLDGPPALLYRSDFEDRTSFRNDPLLYTPQSDRHAS